MTAPRHVSRVPAAGSRPADGAPVGADACVAGADGAPVVTLPLPDACGALAGSSEQPARPAASSAAAPHAARDNGRGKAGRRMTLRTGRGLGDIHDDLHGGGWGGKRPAHSSKQWGTRSRPAKRGFV